MTAPTVEVSRVLMFVLIWIVLLLLLAGCSSYGPSVEVNRTTTTNYTSTGEVVSVVVAEDIKGKQSGIAMMDANETQEQVSDNWRIVELEKMKIFSTAQNCNYPAPPAGGFKGATSEAEYYRMVDNVLDGCKEKQTMLTFAFAFDQSSDSIVEASGAGSMSTQISKSSTQLGVAAEQASASKHKSYVGGAVAAIGIYGLSNTLSNGFAAAGAGQQIVLGPNARYNDAGARSSSYDDGLVVGIGGNSDKDAGIPQNGAGVTPSGGTASASGANEGSPVTESPMNVIFGNGDINTDGVSGFGTGTFDASVFGPQPNVSNDPVVNGTVETTNGGSITSQPVGE